MPQVKVTIEEKIYKQLKKAAKENFRTVTNEINYRLQQSFTPIAPTLTPIAPLPNPNPGIPVEPYKITLQADTTATPTEGRGHHINPDGTRTPPIGGYEEHKNEDNDEPEWDADRGHTRP